MKNIEKYENELRKYGTGFALTKEGKLVNCVGFCCRNCAFNFGCAINKMNWLLQEYKESILDDKEKEFIKNITADLDIKISHIKKYRYVNGNGDTKIRIIISVIDSINKDYEDDFVDFVVTEDMPFEGMELDKAYTLEELGL